MSNVTIILLAAALVLSILVPFGIFLKGEKTRKRYRTSLSYNVFLFFGTLVIGSILLLAGGIPVEAAEGAAEAASAGGVSVGMGYLSAALVTGMSGIGSGIAVASSASAALGAISEDGSVFGKSMIFVAMAEGIALYGLIISFMILGKL